MNRWLPWDRRLGRAMLARYVHSGVTAGMVPGMPPRAEGQSAPAEDRLRALYNAFRELGICYADEPYTSTGGQTVRPPDQVLKLPKHGNCLDLSVTFAGVCLDAGLHPLIVVLDNDLPDRPSHVLVVVWLGGDWTGVSARSAYPLREPVHDTAPRWRVGLSATDEFVAIDIAAVATKWAPGVQVRHGATFEAAVSAACAMLRPGSGWTWGVGVDVGLVHDPDQAIPLPYVPTIPPLMPPYHSPDQVDERPLSQLKARNRVVPFEPREELGLLHRWLTAPGPDTRVAVVHGVGGAGKTRLAAQFAHAHADEGWYTGFLPESVSPSDLTWLAELPSPLLVVLDYVEAAGKANLHALFKALHARRSPTAVLCTARVELSWWAELDGELASAGYSPGPPTPIALDRKHPKSRSVYERAYRRFASHSSPAEPPDIGYRWPWSTTLDLIMLAWIAAQGIRELPQNKSELYKTFIDRELAHWTKTLMERDNVRVDPDVLRLIAACISLLTPRAEDLAATVKAAGIGELSRLLPAEFANTLRWLLREERDDYSAVVAVRPDPIADHLITSVLGNDEAMFARCVELLGAPKGEVSEADQLTLASNVLRCCENLTRAAASDREAARRLAARMLELRPEFAMAAFAVALVHGGPFVQPLEAMAAQPETLLPLREIEPLIPYNHGELRQLALIAAEQCYAQEVDLGAPAETLARVAGEMGQLAVRRVQAGLGQRAIAAGEVAVAIYRQLAEANPAAFLPDLATSLNNLANTQSAVGARTQALTAIQEAVTLRRQLAETNPAAFLPNLATSLNNLAAMQSEVGARTQALAAIQEAVTLRRQLAETNPAAFLPNLATSLNNLANTQSAVGARTEALTAIQEAVTLYRQLAETNPAAFLPNLAMSLNNLAAMQSEIGARTQALTAIQEAVTLRRQLAEANPAAFLPDLAMSLNNLANTQSAVGARTQALTAIQEAVTLYHRLTEETPTLFVDLLIQSLTQLAEHQGNAVAVSAYWSQVCDGLAPGPRAELMTARSLWHRSIGDDPATDADLKLAANFANEEQDPTLAANARLRIRSAVTDATHLQADMPAWATATIPEALLQAITALQSATDRAAYRTAVSQLHILCQQSEMATALSALTELRPDHDAVRDAAALVADANEMGIDGVLTDFDRSQDRLELVEQWLDAGSWADSYRFLRAHPALLNDSDVIEVLMSDFAGPHAERHAIILLLARAYRLSQIFDALLDPTDAEELILAAIATGDPETIQLLWQLTEHISRHPVLSPLAAAVITAYADDGEPDEATTLAAAAGQEASEPLRRDIERRLRARAAHDPDRADLLNQLADAVQAGS
ncbi:MAG TPA: tetratricopeptide repeat protein [Candidatus Limnocylindrales bacterium]|nr:tetratricopeptide repeat protein [Candidatus Limnocylindrales bacterium]